MARSRWKSISDSHTFASQNNRAIYGEILMKSSGFTHFCFAKVVLLHISSILTATSNKAVICLAHFSVASIKWSNKFVLIMHLEFSLVALVLVCICFMQILQSEFELLLLFRCTNYLSWNNCRWSFELKNVFTPIGNSPVCFKFRSTSSLLDFLNVGTWFP
jgi:hypothetical protein